MTVIQFKAAIKKINWHHYKKPPLLEAFENYFKEEKAKETLYEGLGVYFDEFHYYFTPIDVIPFAATRTDGSHFGFLTDFGHTRDLSTAPIVHLKVDDPIHLIAANFSDFWKMMLYLKDPDSLLNSNDLYFKNKEKEWEQILREMAVTDPDLPKKRMSFFEKVKKMLQKEFDLKEMKDPTSYKKNLIRERRKSATLKTVDGIGVIWEEAKHQKIEVFDYSNEQVSEVQRFLKNTNQPSRIKFYRDFTQCYIFGGELRDSMIPFLKKDGFHREAEILKLLKDHGF